VKFCGNSPQKGGLVHQNGGRSKEKRGSCQMYDTKGPYRVFLWYRLGKYQENTNLYHTEIPNRDTTLDFGHPFTLGASSNAFFVMSVEKSAILAGPILASLPV
jgi:hypothetical protein